MSILLEKEVQMLRSFAISIVGKDSEGVYRPAFVRKALRAANRVPTKRFVSSEKFLADLAAMR
jgi:hypothetical protein